MLEYNHPPFEKGDRIVHPLIKHYVWVTLLTSAIVPVLLVIMDRDSDTDLIHFGWGDLIGIVIFAIMTSWSFILIGGGLLSALLRYFVAQRLVLPLFLAIALVLYVVSVLAALNIQILPIYIAVFGLFDALLYRNKDQRIQKSTDT
ncbi:hypothetical protein AR543_04740 [Paenibacillus bovis]|uniref:Uncharacterized protein n=2 Tax=Paenibacillus bovis TaxID=1616788 RepID=A0A172ZCY3_9BACL|nr:hypothetical protein AR543_04740 [Paenibacillus bovis]